MSIFTQFRKLELNLVQNSVVLVSLQLSRVAAVMMSTTDCSKSIASVEKSQLHCSKTISILPFLQ